MNVVAFDTATRATTVALSGVGNVVYTARDDPPPGKRPGHANHLLPLTAMVLDRAGIGWDRVDRIAVGVGPGTFTGLRIGIASARALARARSIPLVGVSTLQSLALAGPAASQTLAGVDTVFAVLDARRGEVFAAGWRIAEVEEFDAALLLPHRVRSRGAGRAAHAARTDHAGDRGRGDSIQGGSRALGSLHSRRRFAAA